MIHCSRRPVLALLTAFAVTLTPACHSWHTADVSPSQFISEEQPARVRLTLRDATTVDLENPEIVGESIVGVPAPQGRGRMMVESLVGVPLGEVVRVDDRRLDRGRTGIMAAIITVGLVATFVSLSANVRDGG